MGKNIAAGPARVLVFDAGVGGLSYLGSYELSDKVYHLYEAKENGR